MLCAEEGGMVCEINFLVHIRERSCGETKYISTITLKLIVNKIIKINILELAGCYLHKTSWSL